MESADSAAWSPTPSEVVVCLECSRAAEWEHVLLVCQSGAGQVFRNSPEECGLLLPSLKKNEFGVWGKREGG